jgi:hypothetical protein
MKLRHAAALPSLGLWTCGSCLLLQWSFLDWCGIGLIVLVVALIGIGFVGLAKTIRK